MLLNMCSKCRVKWWNFAAPSTTDALFFACGEQNTTETAYQAKLVGHEWLYSCDEMCSHKKQTLVYIFEWF